MRAAILRDARGQARVLLRMRAEVVEGPQKNGHLWKRKIRPYFNALIIGDNNTPLPLRVHAWGWPHTSRKVIYVKNVT